ncbi:hypothetical protein [Castellaniella sp.]|uniref:hypothetical protein n=1 Tax=Castellaniella sp. TaxID=1955812 RepID=UPI002AFF6320|nr:hypothetical protein [Castellaniella sp.]
MEKYILKRVLQDLTQLARFAPVVLVNFIAIYLLVSLSVGTFIKDGGFILLLIALSALALMPMYWVIDSYNLVIDSYKEEWLRAEEEHQEEERASDVADHKSALNDIMREADAS